MTELLYLTNSYLKTVEALIKSVQKKGKQWELVTDKTIFFPQGGGQPSDIGTITAKNGKAEVKHVRLSSDGTVIHECDIEGNITVGDMVNLEIDWDHRYQNMRNHTAGHIVHEAVYDINPSLVPIKGDHGKKPYIEYSGSLTIDKQLLIENKANEIVAQNLPVVSKFVTYDELKNLVQNIPEHLPKNKPLRIVTIGNKQPVPDGGTQLASTKETGQITISEMINSEDTVKVYYHIEDVILQNQTKPNTSQSEDASILISQLIEIQTTTLDEIRQSDETEEQLKIKYLGKNSDLAVVTQKMRFVPKTDIARVGIVLKEVKSAIENELVKHTKTIEPEINQYDVTAPGIKPPIGHLHIVSQAITEITDIFNRIGFTRVRHPEADWDFYAFEGLNMPPNHPARDEWETFFIENRISKIEYRKSNKFNKIVLTPHTSNGQVREMEKGILPIRMINIAACYRRQSDVSHAPMFHQFEGLYVDKNVSIAHLKGVLDFFVKQFYGEKREIRIRPFHFQFTEPSFEIDVSCAVCLGKGVLESGDLCRICKEGWLELGGAGMVHPNVLKSGGIDPKIYNGFAFGWGVERTYMMKSGTKLDDVRTLYENDVRFLEQF